MMFLQRHGIAPCSPCGSTRSTAKTRSRCERDPYRLAAISTGSVFFGRQGGAHYRLCEDSKARIMAAIRHVLAAGRELGHCYLLSTDLTRGAGTIGMDPADRLTASSDHGREGHLKVRVLVFRARGQRICYYSKTLYFDELTSPSGSGHEPDPLGRPGTGRPMDRSLLPGSRGFPEQRTGGGGPGVAGKRFSVLTGGPGCGKTTTLSLSQTP